MTQDKYESSTKERYLAHTISHFFILGESSLKLAVLSTVVFEKDDRAFSLFDHAVDRFEIH